MKRSLTTIGMLLISISYIVFVPIQSSYRCCSFCPCFLADVLVRPPDNGEASPEPLPEPNQSLVTAGPPPVQLDTNAPAIALALAGSLTLSTSFKLSRFFNPHHTDNLPQIFRTERDTRRSAR